MMRYIVYAAAVAVAILHQDVWFWNDRTLLFGFMPIGLAYHAAFSVAAACVWALAIGYAWPSTLEDASSESGGPERREGARRP